MKNLPIRQISEVYLSNSYWPQAIPEYMVCKTEQDFHAKSLIISEWAGNKGPILNFACKDTKVQEILESQCIEAVSYNLNQNWSEIQNQSFATIILDDVIDHLTEDRVKIFKKIKKVLSLEGRIKVRCHPWCSRHGGHQISTHNKAFAHLIYPDKWPTEKTIDPIKTYENIFKFSGLKIVDKVCYRTHIEDWILNNFAFKLFSYWPQSMWKGQDCPSILPYLELDYIDYELTQQEI